ncbi:UNVERIFIED_ORG: hypothetical protein M2312_004768 [Rhizobium esperanzae]|nr:hypothetical protein [Rhizobium esperanzae]
MEKGLSPNDLYDGWKWIEPLSTKTHPKETFR